MEKMQKIYIQRYKKNDLMQSITWALSPPKGEEEEEAKEEEGRRVRKFRLSRKFPRLEQKTIACAKLNRRNSEKARKVWMSSSN